MSPHRRAYPLDEKLLTAVEMLLAAYRDIISPEETMNTSLAYPFLMGIANPPHTTSPSTS